MKTRPAPSLRGYLAALRKHLNGDAALDCGAARTLGIRAVKLGLETLDLAKIHKDALLALGTPLYSASTSDERIRRAGTFFSEALTPIEETHRGVREANIQLKSALDALNLLTAELATRNGELKQETVRREAIEESLRTSESTSSQLLERSRQMQDELRNLSRSLLSAQEEERKRISRELHDVISQTLTGINVRLATLKLQTTANSKDFHKKIAITQKLVEKSMGIVHRFAVDLRPTVLDDLGLIPALRSFIKQFTAGTPLNVTFTASPAVEHWDSGVRTVLYRIAQEALSNVSRHSKATRARVTIGERGGMVRMEVMDNGIGFNVDGIDLKKGTGRLGLLGMRERVEMVGGTFCVVSIPGKKTVIKVEIPSHKKPGKKAIRKTSGTTTLKCP